MPLNQATRAVGTGQAVSRDGTPLAVGNIVTRDGSDRQIVVAVGEYNDVTVKCIAASIHGWNKLGDVENNLAGRYVLVPQEAQP